MHKVSRSLLLAGVLAFGTLTAACGDKVTVTQQTPQVGVSSITVTPSSATIGTGAANAITLAVAVVSDATTAKTVTWTSSSSAVATVDATGKVTGVSSGTVTITATSTADATKAAAAVITVNGGAVVPTVNTVAISTVNQTNPVTGTVAPANLNNVAGQVDVTLFVSGPAGTVNLIQNCSAAGATSTVGDVIVAQQQVAGSQNQSPVTLSYNTAATGTVTGGIAVVNNTSATPINVNGNCFLKASLGTAVATNVTPFTLNNASFYRFAFTTSGGTAISTLNGLSYVSGDVTATITPVSYVGGSIATLTGTFAGRTFGPVAPAAGTQTFTVTFPGSIATGALPTTTVAGVACAPNCSLSNYTSPAAGDNLIITSAVTTLGAPGFVNFTPSSALRIDNGAPTAPTAAIVASNTNWLSATPGGAAYVFGSAANYGSGGDAGAPATGVNSDVTVIGYAPSSVAALTGNALYPGFTTAGTGIGPTQCSQSAFTIVSNTTGIPRSATNTAYRARAFEKDALGNVRCTDLLGSAGSPNAATGFFGVDDQAPLIGTPTGPATNTVITTGNTITFPALPPNAQFSDSVSGFVINRQFQYGLWRNFSKVTANCVPIVDGVNPSQTGTTANGCVGVLNSAPTVTLDGGTGTQAYYSLTATAIDQAGNPSATKSFTYLLDGTAPVVQGISIPQNLVGGASTSFTSTATDNVDLASANFNVAYTPASGTVSLYYLGSNYGAKYTAANVTTTATVTATVPFFIQQLQGTTGGGAPVALTAADSGEAQSITIRAVDAAKNVSAASFAAIPNINISSGSGFTAGTQFDTWNVTNTATTLSNGGGGLATTTTLTASAILNSGTAQTATVPFSQVCFFYQANAGDVTIPAGSYAPAVGSSGSNCITAPNITDVAGLSRTWTYQLVGYDPPAALGTASSPNIIAIGIKANGVGIVSPVSPAVTLAP
jgi:hypothetical protein